MPRVQARTRGQKSRQRLRGTTRLRTRSCYDRFSEVTIGAGQCDHRGTRANPQAREGQTPTWQRSASMKSAPTNEFVGGTRSLTFIAAGEAFSSPPIAQPRASLRACEAISSTPIAQPYPDCFVPRNDGYGFAVAHFLSSIFSRLFSFLLILPSYADPMSGPKIGNRHVSG